MRSAMRRTAVFLLLTALVAVASATSQSGRRLLASASASSNSRSVSDGEGSVSSSSSAKSTGGSSSASSFASTETIKELENIFEGLYKSVTVKADGKNCSEIVDVALAEIEAQATAVASVYANALGEVTVEGNGEACADSSADASAEAEVFAEVVASALVTELNGRKTRAVEKIVSEGVAQVFVEAYASVCSTQGFARAEQTSFAEAIVSPIAQAFAYAIGGQECLDEALERTSKSGDASVEESFNTKTESATTVEGNGTAEAGGAATAQGGEGSASADSLALAESNDDDGNADASANAQSSEGLSSATAIATAEISEQVDTILVETFKNVTGQPAEGKTCEDILDIAFAEVGASATSLASVYASAFGEAVVEGQGSACADASASGEAEALAFAKAVAKAAWHQEQDGMDKDMSAKMAVEEIVAEGLAQAFADAYASVCSEGGFSATEQSSLAEAIVTPVATAFAFTLGGSDCLEEAEARAVTGGDSFTEEKLLADTSSTTLVEGKGTSQSAGFASSAGGDADASADSLASSSSDDAEGVVDASSFATSFDGSSFATSIASTEVFEQVQAVAERALTAVAEKTDDFEECDEQALDAVFTEVEAKATAIASAYATAFGEVEVTGDGEACADASASGDAEAEAFATAIAETIGGRFRGEGSDEANVTPALEKIIAAGAAEAFAKAVASACSTGGFASAEQTSFAKAIVSPIAQAFALASGGTACLEAAEARNLTAGGVTFEEEVKATSDSSVVSEGDSTANVDGDTSATTTTIDDPDVIANDIISGVTEQCSRGYRVCCMRSFASKDFCPCTLSTNSRFYRCDARKVASSLTDVVVWDDEQAGTKCRC